MKYFLFSAARSGVEEVGRTPERAGVSSRAGAIATTARQKAAADRARDGGSEGGGSR